MAHSTGAGGDDPFDPWDLDDVRERVVMPVVSSLIRPADLQKVDVGWGPGDELWVLVRADGATWHSQIWQIELADLMETMSDVAWALADRLEDWVCECVYWGEQAQATFVIPERRA
jgi:hypothetical protein